MQIRLFYLKFQHGIYKYSFGVQRKSYRPFPCHLWFLFVTLVDITYVNFFCG